MQTIEQAKEYLRTQLDKGAECPCCTQYVKMYRRRFNAGMSYGLISIYKIYKEKDISFSEYIHVPREFTKRKINPANTEYSKLQYWGLLEQLPNENDPTKKTTGMWKITRRGIHVVLGNLRVEEAVFVFKTKVISKSEEMVHISETLGKKFDYSELMNKREIYD